MYDHISQAVSYLHYCRLYFYMSFIFRIMEEMTIYCQCQYVDSTGCHIHEGSNILVSVTSKTEETHKNRIGK
jgi:hypothetical protein